ncbi:MAG: prolyl oligopeptidase family serine peptidase, partial [Candidatus Heimdallarchaeota archaeon]|nr:prolyl oligopeptidase family serine peptidase [Candidatus Heimdallarchaeota archaeon]
MTITNYVSEFEIIQEPLNYSESKYVTKAFEVLSQRNDVTMVFSHPNRSTFIYCASDESGMIGLYIKEKNVESRLLLNNKELGHASKELLFVLHNSQDIIYMIMDKDGSKNHYITEYNYTSKESRIIAENLDWITVFYEIDNNSLLCIGNREKSMVVYKLDKFNGKETILYTSDLQILSSDYSSEINVLLISEGRGYANIVALDVTNGEEIFRLKESDSSSDRFMSISPNGSSFCYISNVSGTEELIVRSINDRMIIGRTPIPGSGIGFFALDLSYVNWANDNEIVALVTHQGQSQPYKYNIDLKEWHKLLSKYQVLLQLRRTSMGLVFPGGNSSTSYHLFLYSDQNVSKITFPSFQSDGQDKISIWFNSRDGMKIHGWLTRANDPMARLIVIPHGGPSYVDMDNYDPFTSIFVNAGYHVLQPNFRGSTTFGVEYRNALKGDMGGNEVWDVI